MAEGPVVSAQDEALLGDLMKRDEIRDWVRTKQSKPVGGLRAFFGEKETLRLLLTAIIIPVLGWLALKGYAVFDGIYNRERIQRAAMEAAAAQRTNETRQDVAQVATLMPFLAGSEAQRDLALPLLRAMAETPHQNDMSRKMFQTLLAAAQRGTRSVDPAQRERAVHEVELLSPQTAPVAVPAARVLPGNPIAPNARSSTRPSVVYIQIYGEDQRNQATQVAEALRNEGVPVPGIENVVQTHPDSSRRFPQRGAVGVRFYRAIDREAAVYVAALIGRITDGPFARLQDLSGRGGRVRPGLVEIWLPCGAAHGCR